MSKARSKAHGFQNRSAAHTLKGFANGRVEFIPGKIDPNMQETVRQKLYNDMRSAFLSSRQRRYISCPVCEDCGCRIKPKGHNCQAAPRKVKR